LEFTFDRSDFALSKTYEKLDGLPFSFDYCFFCADMQTGKVSCVRSVLSDLLIFITTADYVK